MQRIKKGDEVVVITGKDKGRRGTVNAILKKGKETKIIVDGLNIAKKHVKANPQANQSGGITNKEMPITISNVMLYNLETNKGDRVGFRMEEGKKVRYFKSTGVTI